ncbi:MAG: inositol monophosphatase [Acidobacteria bacterium]|nr:inositol monophosphatase [Acidobacteriota bacterium]
MSEAQRRACVAGAKAGGRVLLRHFRKLTPGQIEEKTQNDLVSQADRGAEEAIRAELAHRFPDYGFLGEESGASGSTLRRWIVDPLDGTLNFVQGVPHWCVSVALWDADGPAAACILDPLKGDTFEAVRGGGARWNGHPMAVSRHEGLEGAFLATGFAFQLGDRFPLWEKALGAVWPRAKGIRRAGAAALDLAYVACGIYDGFFELGLKQWDMAAGALLVHEAGGHVSDWQGGGAWWESGDILAGAPGVQKDLARVFRAQKLA